MKIALCVSGSMRNSQHILQRNIDKLHKVGHKVFLFASIEDSEPRHRIARNNEWSPYLGFFRPWISVFLLNSKLPQPDLFEFKNVVKAEFRIENRTTEEMLRHFDLFATYCELDKTYIQNCRIKFFNLRPYKPFFQNSLRMCVGISEAFKMYEKSEFSADYVLRLRPDFELSDNFVQTIKNTHIQMAVRNDAENWDYGWGYASDQVFGGRPIEMRVLSNALTELRSYWIKDEVINTRSSTVPFVYGDVIFSKLMYLNDINPDLVFNAGDLYRERISRVYPWNRLFWQFYFQERTWRQYLFRVRMHQKVQLIQPGNDKQHLS